jgi:hypothetical protein
MYKVMGERNCEQEQQANGIKMKKKQKEEKWTKR